MLKRKRSPSIAMKLRELKHAEPFSPFKITTSSGEALTITAADRFIVSPRGNTAIISAKGDPSLQVLDLQQVVSIKPVRRVRRTAKRSNGRESK